MAPALDCPGSNLFSIAIVEPLDEHHVPQAKPPVNVPPVQRFSEPIILVRGYSRLLQFASSPPRRKSGLPDRQTVVYLAANAKPPHRAGLAWVRCLAERMPGCAFLIVGGIFDAPERQNNVIATGRIEDPASYLQAADISLCPNRVRWRHQNQDDRIAGCRPSNGRF